MYPNTMNNEGEKKLVDEILNELVKAVTLLRKLYYEQENRINLIEAENILVKKILFNHMKIDSNTVDKLINDIFME